MVFNILEFKLNTRNSMKMLLGTQRGWGDGAGVRGPTPSSASPRPTPPCAILYLRLPCTVSLEQKVSCLK